MNVSEQRLAATRAKFDDWQVDGLLITSPTNRRWLSGFTGSAGALLVTRDKAILSTDSRYWEQAERQAPDFTLFRDKRTRQDLLDFIAGAGVSRIGLEASRVTLAEAEKLSGAPDVEWVHLDETLEPLRFIKTDEEIMRITRAAGITDAAVSHVPALARPGISERALAWELEKMMRSAGAEAVAFSIIVASGPNSALPHHTPGDRLLQQGDALVVDMGAQFEGYKSDLTRTFYLGAEPSEKFQRIYDLVQRAQIAALTGLRPGLSSREADMLARSVIAAGGHGDDFGHGLGHALGLEIHEAPFLSQVRKERELVPGMVLTIEPGVYLPGWGGVRIEDLVLVTHSGSRVLSRAPQQPAVPI